MIFSLASHGQEKKEKLEYATYSVGLSPSAFVNFFNGVQVSQDFALKPNLNLTLESAYIFNSIYSDYTQGFRLKPGLEFIVAAGENSAFVMGLHYNYRRTISPRTIGYIYEFDQYTEEVGVDRIKTLHGLMYSLGALGNITDRLRLEFSLGVGLGVLDIRDINSTATRTIDNAVRFDRSFYFIDSPTNEFFPLGSINLNFSYIIVE
jgi:hypothetical protein